MKVSTQTLLVFLCTLVISGCTPKSQTTTPSDVSLAETLRLKALPNQRHVHSMQIQGFGTVDGDAKIELMLDGKAYKSEAVSGDFSFSWQMDWYADEAEVRYLPEKVTTGKVKLTYRFYD